jgi:hypothetical protein
MARAAAQCFELPMSSRVLSILREHLASRVLKGFGNIAFDVIWRIELNRPLCRTANLFARFPSAS